MVELPDIQEIREDGGPVDDNTEENIHAEAKQNGKEEERMKGDDSDTMFLMVALALASSVINSGVLIWINFLA